MMGMHNEKHVMSPIFWPQSLIAYLSKQALASLDSVSSF